MLKTRFWNLLTQISLHWNLSFVRVVLLDGYCKQKPRSHPASTYLLQTPKQYKIQSRFISQNSKFLNKGTVTVVSMPMVSLRRKWRETKGNWTTSGVRYMEKLASSKVPFGFLLKKVLDALHRQSCLMEGLWINSRPDPAYPDTSYYHALVIVSQRLSIWTRKFNSSLVQTHRKQCLGATSPSIVVYLNQVSSGTLCSQWHTLVTIHLTRFAISSINAISLSLMRKVVQATHSGMGVDIFGQSNPTYYVETTKTETILKRYSIQNTNQKTI